MLRSRKNYKFRLRRKVEWDEPIFTTAIEMMGQANSWVKPALQEGEDE
ncbi:MAG: hypothetical protein WD688_24675 [Candidatus Binatia bacterium]